MKMMMMMIYVTTASAINDRLWIACARKQEAQLSQRDARRPLSIENLIKSNLGYLALYNDSLCETVCSGDDQLLHNCTISGISKSSQIAIDEMILKVTQGHHKYCRYVAIYWRSILSLNATNNKNVPGYESDASQQWQRWQPEQYSRNSSGRMFR